MKVPTRSRQLAVAAVLLLFSLFGIGRHLHAIGDDLSSSYIGCRLVAEGQSTHLFAHDSKLFNVENDPAWIDSAEAGSFPEDGMLHPYVQTPLWAWSLRPLCEHTTFPQFSRIFVVLFMLATSATIWLVARYWTNSFCILFARGKFLADGLYAHMEPASVPESSHLFAKRIHSLQL